MQVINAQAPVLNLDAARHNLVGGVGKPGQGGLDHERFVHVNGTLSGAKALTTGDRHGGRVVWAGM